MNNKGFSGNVGDVETGIADALTAVPSHHAPVPSPPNWLVNWETRRPPLLVALVAEVIGVFLYVYAGVGASAAFFVTSAAGEGTAYGNLLTIGVCYGLGIAFGIIVATPTSGGHLSPCFTIAFWLFKGFPARKVPFYILAQIFGAFLAALTVYGQYKEQIDEIHMLMVAGGKGAAVFSPQGPAGLFGLMPGATQGSAFLFFNEFMVCVILAIVVFSAIDPCSFVVSLSTVPFVIGLAYTVCICCFAPASIALNTARDLGGRIACSAIYGRGCFNTYSSYSAIAALVNIPATLIGCFIQTCFLSDTARLLVNLPPNERAMVDEHIANRDAALNDSKSRGYQGGGVSLRQLTRESMTHKN